MKFLIGLEGLSLWCAMRIGCEAAFLHGGRHASGARQASVTEEDGEAWAFVRDKLKEKSRRIASRHAALAADHDVRKTMVARGELYYGDGVLLDSKLEDNEDAWLRQLESLALRAVRDSTGKDTESSGQGRYAWGTWVDNDKLKALREALDVARLVGDDDWWNSVLDGSDAAAVTIFADNYYSATLRLFEPIAGSESKMTCQFPAGGHVLLKPLYGSISFQKLRRTRGDGMVPLGKERKLVGASEVSSETLGGVFGALGGPPHALSSKGRAALLEIVLRPPTGYDKQAQQISSRALVDLVRLGLSQFADANKTLKTDLAAATAASLKKQVGGLEAQLEAIVRRVLASRADPEAARRLGVSHVRGVLLSGPPGCGKSLLARQLARELGAREPQIVNGPEILDKFVGEAERKVRELFAPAEIEYAAVGDKSALHVIILDEMDAIARHRGSLAGDTTGVRDGVVNTLLAKMDGVNDVPNVLVVGLTNRPELIDDALKRPGRLEVHVTIGRPDREGRRDILRIHTRQMRKNGALSREAAAFVDAVNDDSLAARAEDFSGAELAGLVRSAASFALGRSATDSADATVLRTDLELALAELEANAATEMHLISARFEPFGILGDHSAEVLAELETFLCHETKHGVDSMLLVPAVRGAGATALAAWASFDAKKRDAVDFVDFVDAADLRIVEGPGGLDTIFRELEQRGRALLVLDDVDLLVDNYARLRAQCRRPAEGKILATVSSPDPPRDILNAFAYVLPVPGIACPSQADAVLEPIFPHHAHLRTRLADAALASSAPIGCKRLTNAAVRAKTRFFAGNSGNGDDDAIVSALQSYLTEFK